MRRTKYIFLILVIAYLSALPVVTKANINANSTMQVVGNLSLVESEISEEDEENFLEEKRTILKKEKLPATGTKIQEDLFFIGVLSILLSMLVKTQNKKLK